MSEPAHEGRVLALIEAEFRADDPRLIALFDAFARDSLAPSAPRLPSAVRGRWKALAKGLLVLLLVPLTIMTVMAALSGSRGAVAGGPPSAVAGLGRQTAAAMEMWAARQGQAIRSQICRSIPLPAGTACQ
jgi:hypothetical protein